MNTPSSAGWSDTGTAFGSLASLDDTTAEVNEEEVRRLAELFSPQVQELDALLADTTTATQRASSNPGTDDDDSMDNELQHLADAEDLLRQELEFVGNFSSLGGSRRHLTIDTSTPDNDSGSIKTSQQQPSSTVSSLLTSPSFLPLPRRLEMTEPDTPQSQATTDTSSIASGNTQYTLREHASTLRVEKQRGGWYSVDMSSFLKGPPSESKNLLLEYCWPLPLQKLKTLYVGISQEAGEATETSESISSTPSKSEVSKSRVKEPLPLRTFCIRVRPDVLVGAVMDACHHALADANVVKRQGGHFQAILDSGLFVDVQLCLYKTDECQRILLIRFFYGQDMDSTMTTTWPQPGNTPADSDGEDGNEENSANQHLRQACALVQRMEIPNSSKSSSWISGSPSSSRLRLDKPIEAISAQLLQTYKACPSVLQRSTTFPALCPEDWTFLQSAWPWAVKLWEELETRDLTYWNLTATCRFGAFPALPTLDVHYCSQIRRFSRETMVLQLLKSASELEDFAREAEYACANMVAMLRPAFQVYEATAPELPRPAPLTSYPLQFAAPQTTCPPWGPKVMEALNQVAAMTTIHEESKPHSNSEGAMFEEHLSADEARVSSEMSKQAVALVFSAFQKQDDEEQSARLQRKNLQVMDRLAKMQNHQKALIAVLQRCTGPSAMKAKEDFYTKATQAQNEDAPKSILKEVPILKSTILVSGSTGTCLVTRSYILFVTQLIPMVGRSKKLLYQLEDMEFEVQEESQSLLNPLPVTLTMKKGGTEILAFRPSVGGARLRSFIEIVKKVGQDKAALPEHTLPGQDSP